MMTFYIKRAKILGLSDVLDVTSDVSDVKCDVPQSFRTFKKVLEGSRNF